MMSKPRDWLTRGTFANHSTWPELNLSELASVAKKLRASAPPTRVVGLQVSPWFPAKQLQPDGTVRLLHGQMIDGILFCSREMRDYIEAEAGKLSAEDERAAKVREMLAEILGGGR